MRPVRAETWNPLRAAAIARRLDRSHVVARGGRTVVGGYAESSAAESELALLTVNGQPYTGQDIIAGDTLAGTTGKTVASYSATRESDGLMLGSGTFNPWEWEIVVPDPGDGEAVIIDIWDARGGDVEITGDGPPILELDAFGWFQSSVDGAWYKVRDTSMKFDEAEAYAVALGGHLASVHSVEAMQWITDTFRGSFIGIMLGGHAFEESWEWTDGSSWDYTQWEQSYPTRPQYEWGYEIRYWSAAALRSESIPGIAEDGNWEDIGIYTGGYPLFRIPSMDGLTPEQWDAIIADAGGMPS